MVVDFRKLNEKTIRDRYPMPNINDVLDRIDHITHLDAVFRKLSQAYLKIQPDKSEFLRHIVTEDGIKPNPKKIAAVKTFPIPTTRKEIKSLLCLLGYYRKFIRDFAKITKPMTQQSKGKAPVLVSEDFKKSINLQEFIDGTVNFQRAINKLERNIQSEYAIESLSTKLGQLQARVEKLLPNRRQKRGLINGLGNVIKIVTGNLDDTDGRRIQDSLKTISENQKDLTVNVKKQEVINNDILNRFDNITEHINREQQIINNLIIILVNR
ncbi:uncharacterized protein LOC122756605 [Drosophila santomea]|uniref:uncharacterized protein LOC122756605 n=1 Tax=Drosophila santomea TaxID=129105 RepID=UPI001CC9C016|nr:uncharacterized protein LOC122756605 [Drosophila santomea]